MKVSVISASELGPYELGRWEELQRSHPGLQSPCFSPQFTLAAAAARADVRVAVLEEDRKIIGFFPFQTHWGAGLPVGGRLSDHHGVIAAPQTQWDWHDLLRQARLAYWRFDHLPASQRPGGPVVQAESPGLDLSGGYDAWWGRKLAAGSSLAKLPRSLRKLEHDVGPLRLVLDSRDPEVYSTVIRLKSGQCRRTGQLDFFSLHWTRALVEHIRDVDQPAFGGRLSALYAGDTLVAAHFGMRSASVWHWWFPVYSQDHRAYSPGLLLLLKVAEAAASQGHQLLDLGKGDEAYKARVADCAAPLVEGCISRPAVMTAMRDLRHAAGAWWRGSPLTQPLRPLVRRVRRSAASR